MHGQGQAGLPAVAVIEAQKGVEILAVAEEEAVETLAVDRQLPLLLITSNGYG